MANFDPWLNLRHHPGRLGQTVPDLAMSFWRPFWLNAQLMLTSPLFFGHHRPVKFVLSSWTSPLTLDTHLTHSALFFKGSSRLKPYFHFSIASTCLRHQCSSLSGDFCLIESCQQKQNLFSRDFFSPPFRTIQNGGDLVT